MKNKDKTDYQALIKELKSSGPERLYLLWGEEDYLREQFFLQIKNLTVERETSEFNHKRIDGPDISLEDLSEGINSVPFFAEKTLVEVRDFDINKCKDSFLATLKELLSDIPEYCTVVFILRSDYEPDGRTSAFKTMKSLGRAIEFSAQSQSQLVRWISRRFEAYNKRITNDDAQYLIFCSGSLMTRLIPEIEKLATYAPGDQITRGDIDTAASRVPEADIFEMTDKLAAGDYDGASRIMAGLLQMREHPIMLLAMIGQQMRRLYAARFAIDSGLGKKYVADVCNIKYDFILNKLLSAARGFGKEQLAGYVELCAECDYAMKSSSADDTDILKDLLIKMALGAKK